MSTVYEVETKNDEGQVQIVTVSVEPDHKPVIVSVEQGESSVTSSVTTKTETKTTKKVSEITGEVVTVSTGLEVVELVKDITPVLIKEVPEIANCEPVYAEETESSGETTWNTMVCASEKETIQVTSTFNKVTK